MENREAYAMGLQDFKPGQVDTPRLKLKVSDGPPVIQARRVLNPDDSQFMTEITKEYDRMGIWKAPPQEWGDKLWVANPVIPAKTDPVTGEKKRRVTVDFAGPNSRIVAPPGCIPLVSELADWLGGGQC